MVDGWQRPGDERVLDLIGRLYDAAISPAEWPATIREIAQAFGAVSGDFHGWNKQTRKFEFAFTYNFDHLVADYAAHYIQLNPRIDYWDANPGHTLIYDHLHTDERGMDRDEFYTWMERESDVRYCLGMRVENTPDSQVVCGIHFSRRHGHVQAEDIRRFQILAPHLMRAVQLSRRLGGEDLKAQTLEHAVEAMSCGVILANRDARVLFANRSAEEVLAAGDGLATNGNAVLCAERLKDTRRLRDAVAAAIRPNELAGGKARLTLLLDRPSGAPPYEVLVAPAQGAVPFATDAPAALLLINDIESQRFLPFALLSEHFRLTPAEIRLCNALLEGSGPPELAQHLCVTEGTVRTRLKRVLSKTGTHRQAQLTALLHRLQRDWRKP